MTSRGRKKRGQKPNTGRRLFGASLHDRAVCVCRHVYGLIIDQEIALVVAVLGVFPSKQKMVVVRSGDSSKGKALTCLRNTLLPVCSSLPACLRELADCLLFRIYCVSHPVCTTRWIPLARHYNSVLVVDCGKASFTLPLMHSR